MCPERVIAQQALCIHEAFERVAAARADHPAVVCAGERWTFARLNSEANRIAHTLIRLGIRSEEPVAIALPRSCEHIAAMLGVLKAGGAYVPIVDNQPLPRLLSMLQNSQARFLLTRNGHLDGLKGEVQNILTADSWASSSQTNPGLSCNPSDLAYVMYTSGSTGEPKGVMIEHAGVHRLVHDQWFMPTGADINYLCVSSFGFDASTIEVYATLLHGATLVMTSRRVPEPDEVRALIRNERVRAIWIAFGFFGALFDADPDMFRSVEVIMTGGEPVGADLIRRAQHALPGTRFVNSYGPTECTALSTAYEVPLLDDGVSGLLPIGRALRGMSCRVVDSSGNDVSPGEPGELLISGIGIMRGYLDEPELTAQRLILDHDSQRTYRSGDLVRIQDDGEIMFLGRLDTQVKLRGNRFELGEVEVVAQSLDGVTSSVACLFGSDADKKLGLLYTTDDDQLKPGSLRSHIAKLLPAYMVPDLMRRCQTIPLNRNGKIDRAQARLILEGTRGSDGFARNADFENETEKVLAGLMSEVLGGPVRSRYDRFLDMGGHSLRAIVLCARIQDRMGVRLPVSSIYRYPSVTELSARIAESSGSGETARQDIGQGHSDGALAPLSFNQQRLWMLDQLYPGDPSYTITIRLDQAGELDCRAFDQAWSWLCRRHDVLRSRISSVGDEPRAEFDDALPGKPVRIDVRDRASSDIDMMIERESSRGFDLEHGPLARCSVLSGSMASVVVISMHHIISDAWSCSVLQSELKEAYLAYAQGRSPSSTELTVHYADYAIRERELAQTPTYLSDLSQWVESLRGAPIARLPADHQGGGASSSTGIREEIPIDLDLLERIHETAHQLGVTPFVYMFAIFKIWVYRMTLEPDLVIGVPVANRQMPGTQGLIGFFMETLAVRDRLNPGDTVEQVVMAVNQSVLDAFDRRDVPFQHIVEELGLQGQPDQNPLFEIFFNHIAIPLRNCGGEAVLEFSNQDIDNHTAKFDLTCYVFEDPSNPRIAFNARRSKYSPLTVRWYLMLFMRLLTKSMDCLELPASDVPIDVTPISTLDASRVPAPTLPVGFSTTGSITERIKRVVLANPQSEAVRTCRSSVTYKELWDAAGAIAARLRQLGVQPGDRVLIVTRDPVHTCAAVIGTLRLGAVFVPSDDYWPDDRFRCIEEVAQPSAVIHDPLNPCLWFSGPKLDISSVSGRSEWREDTLASPHDAAYIMFTSGTTGVPKGVVQSHAGVVGHMVTFAHALELKKDERLVQFSSFAFDAAIMDMFACWFTGATLCVAEPRKHQQSEIAQWLEQSRVDVVHAAPTLMRWFTRVDDAGKIGSVRTVVLGGEHATDHDIDDVLSVFPNCENLVNGMGMTESSLTLQYRIDPRASVDWPSRLPIGYGVEGTKVRLVTESGLSAGPTGEIEIVSDRIALGYIEPFTEIGELADIPGKRRFRTGDIGTVRHDGSIMHLRRADDQVQIRGCRVEPEEVIRVIRSLDGVKDAAVIAVPSPSGSDELHAYVQCDQSVDGGVLVHGCATSLPAYMVPDHWHRVDQIPRVGGGKLDRSALISQRKSMFVTTDHEIPGETNEQTSVIMAGFEHVLSCEMVGPDDHFFQLGGNSLRAIQLFVHLRERLQLDIPISVIYRAPTPRLLSVEFDRITQSSTDDQHMIQLRASESEQRVFLLPGIGGHPLGFGPLIDRIQTPMGFVGVQYPGQHVLDQIGRTLTSLASWVIDEMHLGERDPVPDMIGYSFGGSLAMEIAMQLRMQGRQSGRILLLDAHLPYGLPRRGRLGKARAHLARIVEGHEASRLGYIKQRLSQRVKPGNGMHDQHADTELHAYRAISRVNRQMVIEYEPASSYNERVTLVRARQPEWLRFHRDDGYNGYSAIIDPALIHLVEVDAGHLDLFKPGPADQIARIVDTWLGESGG